ncbi:MAG: Glycosyltransferase [Candidatus Moranbacteria bacterium GW2011_GWC2_37_8]|nr:MAG: Glycosyltransferase [Candidatus Moranbacteria bacterium GW2011_GWC2_37_8]KKQ63233.1 MAG: Glycosyltransferase [Parcubacteria group bacterium GW2011_GWC1_38_22]
MKKKLSIAMVAPPFGQTGGPEVVTKNLTNALLKMNIDVTLFAPADWITEAKHVHTLTQSLWEMKNSLQSSDERRMLRIKSQMEVIKHESDFDIIHLHSQKYASLVGQASKKPCVLTFHNKMSDPEFSEIAKAGIFTVALSESHKKDFDVSCIIRNGVEVSKITPSYEKGKYLIAIGRLTQPKGIDIAIEIANRTNKKLLIFGRIGNSKERQEYYNEKIKPFLSSNIVNMGEASQEEIFRYLSGAEALLFPIRRNIKVCPLTVIESLACGTPVIGTAMDPFPECLENPKIGFFSQNVEELVNAVHSINSFDRRICRKIAEDNFDSSAMAKEYLKLYEQILKNN